MTSIIAFVYGHVGEVHAATQRRRLNRHLHDPVALQSENRDRDWPRISFDGTRRVLHRKGGAGN